jgi:hypothetical protein
MAVEGRPSCIFPRIFPTCDSLASRSTREEDTTAKAKMDLSSFVGGGEGVQLLARE